MRQSTIHIRDDDVVLLRTIVFMQTEVRLCPVDTVIALGITYEQATILCLSRRDGGNLPSLVIHSVLVAILEDCVISTAAAFPWQVVNDYDLPRYRRMQLLAYITLNALNQVVVNQ
jgi:hypothetical protein